MNKLIVANYKMNGDKKFFHLVNKTIKHIKIKDTEIILCPPFVYLSQLKINNKNVSLGSQDISNKQNKKCTGQISASMLKEFGAKYAIVGHSERRDIGETDSFISEKVENCVANSICPIICVGEQEKTSSINCLADQIRIVVSKITSNNIIIAYEPVWAIGSGEIPTKTQINKAISLIKSTLKELKLQNVKVLYGGSVNISNYKDLLSTKADGFLLGGISLNLTDFISLVKGVENE